MQISLNTKCDFCADRSRYALVDAKGERHLLCSLMAHGDEVPFAGCRCYMEI